VKPSVVAYPHILATADSETKSVASFSALNPLQDKVLPFLDDLLWWLTLLDDAPPGTQHERPNDSLWQMVVSAAVIKAVKSRTQLD
jgi:hypothetical protein